MSCIKNIVRVIAYPNYRGCDTVKREMATIKKNLLMLLEREPQIFQSYNQVVCRYWEMFDKVHNFRGVVDVTSCESITRALRELVKNEEILLTMRERRNRQKKEESFRRYYAERIPMQMETDDDVKEEKSG